MKGEDRQTEALQAEKKKGEADRRFFKTRLIKPKGPPEEGKKRPERKKFENPPPRKGNETQAHEDSFGSIPQPGQSKLGTTYRGEMYAAGRRGGEGAKARSRNHLGEHL